MRVRSYEPSRCRQAFSFDHCQPTVWLSVCLCKNVAVLMFAAIIDVMSVWMMGNCIGQGISMVKLAQEIQEALQQHII
ncbi:hypothetical protein Pmani_023350 [Petrolisthes manimaculis]|uniref:Uncharacterized protein n=1 Tax=Petrolisthes manimaculis TaxID=1843537 RepID=A0AAE1NRH2_9EUCA|nr:hypothetical protein Pmani_033168 [Petrolisthes manimaculis]KAK4304720.1 hypothetical protein Pmani_023350 [Petrolisthes manimaculis]